MESGETIKISDENLVTPDLLYDNAKQIASHIADPTTKVLFLAWSVFVIEQITIRQEIIERLIDAD